MSSRGPTLPKTAPSKFSLSLGSSRASAPDPSKSNKKRPHASSALALAEDDLGSDDDSSHQQISSFGKGLGDNSAKKAAKKEERVIASIPDYDWQAQSRRKRERQGQQNSSNPTSHLANGNTDTSEVGGSIPKFGLNVLDKSQTANAEETQENGLPQDTSESTLQPTKTQTADEEALSALLGNKPKTQHTIIAPPSPPPSEDQVFRNSYAAAPRASTLDEYEATPIDGYGAAILRGYLKSGQSLESHAEKRGGGKGPNGKPAWIPERRPGSLGFGSKDSGLGVELGAWGKGAGKGRGPKQDEITFIPLARRNKNTGEVLAEDDLKKKLDDQSRIVVDESRQRSGHDGVNKDHVSSKHDRRHDSDRNSEDYQSRSHRHRDDKRRKHGEDDDSDRRHRRRDRDSRHDEDYERSERRDKYRDRDHSSERSKRHRDTSRDARDSERHSHRDRKKERREERDRRSSHRDEKIR